MTDPIADLLTRLRNAYMADLPETVVPASKVKETILAVIKQYGFIADYSSEQDERGFDQFRVVLSEEKKPTSIKRVSKPGQRIYIKQKDLKKVKNGLGISIVSTSQGVMSNVEAYKKGLGGELIAEIW